MIGCIAASAQREIITNGLKLYLDASNPASYPKSGTTWYDLSGNGNNATLLNGATFSSGNDGSILFDGINDYGSFNVSPDFGFGAGAFSISIWYKINTTLAASCIFSIGGSNTPYGAIYSSYGQNRVMYYANGFHIRPTVTQIVDRWYNIILTGNGGVDGSRNIKLYLDCVQVGATYTFNYNFPTNTFEIGANQSYHGELMRGNISQILIYKGKELTQQEMIQNFEATRSRYGI